MKARIITLLLTLFLLLTSTLYFKSFSKQMNLHQSAIHIHHHAHNGTVHKHSHSHISISFADYFINVLSDNRIDSFSLEKRYWLLSTFVPDSLKKSIFRPPIA